MLFLQVHVDDYVITGTPHLVQSFIEYMQHKYKISSVGELDHVLQMKIAGGGDKGYVSISQKKHIMDLAVQFDMQHCNTQLQPMEPTLKLDKHEGGSTEHPFQSLLGSLLWIARKTRPDAYFSVIYLARHCTSYGLSHWRALKKLLSYVISTAEYTLNFKASSSATKLQVTAYSDSDWANDTVDRKSYSGSMIYLDGNLIEWNTSRQHCVTTSSTEAEYIATSDTAKNMLHIMYVCSEFSPVDLPMILMLDNKGAEFIAQNKVNNKRSKHIDIRYHMIRDWIEKGYVKLKHVNTHDNPADLMTKALSKEKTAKFANMSMQMDVGIKT